jgi:diamine N-acetyltransferase
MDEMSVNLREITKENYRQATRLKVASGQEGFVASNAVSIADSKFHPTFECIGIYDDDTMVGFLMHGLDDAGNGNRWIIRLMTDAAHQGKGYGREAMRQILERFRNDPTCKEVGISYEPANTVAQKLYASFGFVETGELDDGETVARLKFEQPVAQETK